MICVMTVFFRLLSCFIFRFINRLHSSAPFVWLRIAMNLCVKKQFTRMNVLTEMLQCHTKQSKFTLQIFLQCFFLKILSYLKSYDHWDTYGSLSESTYTRVHTVLLSNNETRLSCCQIINKNLREASQTQDRKKWSKQTFWKYARIYNDNTSRKSMLFTHKLRNLLIG